MMTDSLIMTDIQLMSDIPFMMQLKSLLKQRKQKVFVKVQLRDTMIPLDIFDNKRRILSFFVEDYIVKVKII